MLELTRVRDKKGKYKHSSWHNFKKRKRGWREYAIHPITVSVFGLISYVGVHTAWAFDEAGKLESKFTIYNFSQENAREDSKGDGLSPSTNPEESTGETVKAVSESEPREGEAGTPTMDHSPSSVEAKIREVFREEAGTAIKIFKCESWRDGRYHTDIVGDKDLAFTHNGQLYGRSIGVAQIRTGGIEKNGRIWVASDNVAEFEEKMKNPEENLKMARAKYDASVKRNGNGWYPWFNCAKRAGAL